MEPVTASDPPQMMMKFERINQIVMQHSDRLSALPSGLLLTMPSIRMPSKCLSAAIKADMPDSSGVIGAARRIRGPRRRIQGPNLLLAELFVMTRVGSSAHLALSETVLQSVSLPLYNEEVVLSTAYLSLKIADSVKLAL